MEDAAGRHRSEERPDCLTWQEVADAAYCIKLEQLERQVLAEQQMLVVRAAVAGAEVDEDSWPTFVGRQQMLDEQLAAKPKRETAQEKLMRELGLA